MLHKRSHSQGHIRRNSGTAGGNISPRFALGELGKESKPAAFDGVVDVRESRNVSGTATPTETYGTSLLEMEFPGQRTPSGVERDRAQRRQGFGKVPEVPRIPEGEMLPSLRTEAEGPGRLRLPPRGHLETISHFAFKGATNLLISVGHVIRWSPWLVIFLMTGLAGVLSVGVVLNFEMNNDMMSLLLGEEHFASRNWDTGDTDIRLPHHHNSECRIAMYKKDNSNMLTEVDVEAFRVVVDAIEAKLVAADLATMACSDMKQAECFVAARNRVSIFDAQYYFRANPALETNPDNTTYRGYRWPLAYDERSPISITLGVQPTYRLFAEPTLDEQNRVKEAKFLRSSWRECSSGGTFRAFPDIVSDVYETLDDKYDMVWYDMHYESFGLDESLPRDLNLVLAAVGGIALFCVIFASRPLLALCGLLSTIFAVISTFGFMAWLEIPLNPLAGLTPFLILAIGVDDMFILIASFDVASTRKEKDRLTETLREAGVSILVTSMTDISVFLPGAWLYSSEGLHVLSKYCAVGIAMDLLFQITFFVACLVIVARREEKRQIKLQEPLNVLPVVARADYEESSIRVVPVDPSEGGPANGGDAPEPVKSIFGRLLECCYITPDRIAASWQRWVLEKPRLWFLIFIAYLILTIYGIGNIPYGWEIKAFLARGTFLMDWVAMKPRFYSKEGFGFGVIVTDGTCDFGNREIIDVFERKTRKLEALDCVNDETTDAFFRYIVECQNTDCVPECATDDLATCSEYLLSLDTWKNIRVQYADDNSTVAFQFTMRTLGGDPFDFDRAACVRSLREIEQEFPCDVKIFSVLFPLWEIDEMVRQEFEQTFSIAFSVCCVVCFLFIPDLWLVVVAVTNLAITEFGIIAAIYWLGLRVDFIILVLIIMGMGLNVDYSIHIVMKYNELSHLTRMSELIVEFGDNKEHATQFLEFFSPRERVDEAIATMGGALARVGFSTILGLSVLVFCETNMLSTFGTYLIAITVIGLFVNLTFLPASLSAFGALIDRELQSEKSNSPTRYKRKGNIRNSPRRDVTSTFGF